MTEVSGFAMIPHATHEIPWDRDRRHLGDLAQPLARWMTIVAASALALSLILGLVNGDGFRHLLHGYLVSYATLLSITLGGLFFVAIQHLCGAAWSVTVRRLAEIIASNMPLMALLSLPIVISLVIGSDSLYPWNNPEVVRANQLLVNKQAYLNVPFFCIRLAIFFIAWCGLSRFFYSKSVKQDSSGDPQLTDSMRGVSAPTMLIFALTVTFASFDLLMSLTPLWYSTIFGVYIFAGGMVGFFSLLILSALTLRRLGLLTASITVEHYHDLGKFLFGFVFFWGYIAFSQFMLIWYANLPEETSWYVTRQTGSWIYVSLALVIFHFIVPFLGLLSRHAKRNLSVLGFWAGLMLIMHWVDLYYIVMPSLSPTGAPFPLIDITLAIGLGALYVLGLARTAVKSSLVPERDPRLARSLSFHNV